MSVESSPAIHILQLGRWLGEAMREALPAPFVVHPLYLAEDRETELASCAADVRALLCHSGGILVDRALLDRLPRLELIVNLGAGTDAVDLPLAKARGIPVLDSAGMNAVDVAELAMGLMLSMARHIPAGDRAVRAGQWRDASAVMGARLQGKRLGVLGMGAIGQALAVRAAAFGMEVSYFSRRRVEGLAWRHVPDLLTLAGEVDWLVSALPGGSATHHLVNAAVMVALGPQGTFVSVGRGSVVDEAALAEALASGRLGGAALDVFEHEPNVPEALIRSERTVLQAHAGGRTVEAHAVIVAEAVRRLHRQFGLAH